MQPSPRHLLFLLALLACSASPAGASSSDDPLIVGSRGFLDAHPDIRLRERAGSDYRAKRYREAFNEFKDAARYADKTSQAMVAEMLWNGQGTSVDKPLAYAWIDLAAERGYASLIVQRERYWSELDATQRARAVSVGEGVYAEYGDAVAKPRMERELRSARLAITGSHLGRVGTLAIPGKVRTAPGAAAGIGDMVDVVDGSRYFDARYWEPAQYWKWQDQQWRNADSHVEVGAPQSLDGK